MSASTRPDADGSAPTAAQAARDVLVRAALPAVALLAVLLGIGLLITGPLHGLPAEHGLSRALADGRTPTMNALTGYGSSTGSTLVIVACTLVAVLGLWWGTRQWWSAVVPAIAVSLELVVFLVVSLVVGRPRPDVPHLDQAPPTSSYPSGHTGAATALWFSLALLARRIRTPWLRALVTLVCVLVPFAVAYSRMYRGMHSASDVAAGFLNGAVCAGLAYGCLRREPSSATPASQHGAERAVPAVVPQVHGLGAGASDARVPGAGEGVEAVRGEPHGDESEQHAAER